MSKYRFKHTGKAKLRVKTGADAEISNQQYDLATLLAEVAVKRNQLSGTVVQGEQKPSLNELLGRPT